jgi:hypothetical protein
MKLPSVDMSDSVAWHYEKSSLFSIKSAYRLALMTDHDLGSSGSSTVPDGGRMIWKKLWNLSIPPKIKVFLWRTTNNGLATNANRNYRHMTPTSCCSICGHKNENCLHALVQCPHAVVLHNAMHNKWGTPRPREFCGLGPDWIMYLLNHKNEKDMLKIAFVLWRVWSVRNSVTQTGE